MCITTRSLPLALDACHHPRAHHVDEHPFKQVKIGQKLRYTDECTTDQLAEVGVRDGCPDEAAFAAGLQVVLVDEALTQRALLAEPVVLTQPGNRERERRLTRLAA